MEYKPILNYLRFCGHHCGTIIIIIIHNSLSQPGNQMAQFPIIKGIKKTALKVTTPQGDKIATSYLT
jgi:hypothetical protein